MTSTTAPPRRSAPAGAPVVRLRGVAVGYGDRAVVEGIDLTIEDGEVVALVGPNGSGKTTLVRGLLGLAPVLSGAVEVLGRPVRHRRDRSWIGYVPQRHTVAGTVPVKVREVVTSGRLPRMGWHGRPRAADRAAVRTAIAAVGLQDVAECDLGRLSGGQQRRALIARALAAEPALLVMDEPTAGVDRGSQRALAKAIRGLADTGVPMLIVTHDEASLADVVTRTLTLQEGRIATPPTALDPAADPTRAAAQLPVGPRSGG
ncbi:MAG: metal ABC transporter ATP-binding protein [Angustibacter sp.]